MFGIADNHEFLVAIGIDNSPNRDAIVANLERIAEQKLTLKISEKLTPSQIEELNNISDEEQVAKWLDENLPELSALVTETLSELKYEVLSTKAAILGQPQNDLGIEKGEIVKLSDNRDYVCLSVIIDNRRKYLYLMTTSEPINFCFAEEIIVNNNNFQIRIIGDKNEKLRLFELLKTQMPDVFN